jgi:hypothetical protein
MELIKSARLIVMWKLSRDVIKLMRLKRIHLGVDRSGAILQGWWWGVTIL